MLCFISLLIIISSSSSSCSSSSRSSSNSSSSINYFIIFYSPGFIFTPLEIFVYILYNSMNIHFCDFVILRLNK